MYRARLEAPDLDWIGTSPRSRRFADIYFQPDHGPEECRHVFLSGNDLPRRWQRSAPFTIAETGFGTGLNFLTTWARWRESAPPGAFLDYLSVEAFPLSRTDLDRALSTWPEFSPLAQCLAAQWPPPEAGFHRLSLDQGRVRLTLLYGQVLTALNHLEARVDAWFLDGFAPARNPEMWSPEVCRTIAGLTATDGTFATYTVAGQVRRGLESAGFRCHKRPGFGDKREMLSGSMAEGLATPSAAPWLALPAAHRSVREALVIGAGLAGVCSACALAGRGWRVTLLDRHAGPAAAASGNAAAIYMPQLSADLSAAQRWHSSGFHMLGRTLDLIPGNGRSGPAGVLALAWNQRESQRFREIAERGLWSEQTVRPVSPERAAALAGIPIPHSGLHLPGAGWLDPVALCRDLLDQPTGIQTRFDCAVADLAHDGHGWCAIDVQGRALGHAPVVVLASGSEGGAALGLSWLPITPLRGQVSGFAADTVGRGLRMPICGPGYVIPPQHGLLWVGATFSRDNPDPAPTAQDDQRNRATMTAFLPALGPTLAAPAVSGRAGFRASTPDRLPLLGPVVDHSEFLRTYADLGHGRRAARYPDAPYRPGLYVCAGFGSRALVSAPLAAELLAAQIEGTALPVERDLRQVLMPQRFSVRSLRRGIGTAQ